MIDAIKDIRCTMGISQDAIARELHITQPTYSKYENGQLNIPEDVKLNIIRFLNSPRASAICSAEMKTDCINVPLLNNVSEDIYTILDVMIFEAKEMINAAESMKQIVRNKSNADDLSGKDWEAIYKHQEQIIDMIPAIKLQLIRMSEVFGLDIRKAERLIIMKLKNRKHLRD